MKRPNTWSEHPEAREELLAESDRLPEDIAEMFIKHTEIAVRDILESPHSWPKVHYWDGSPTLRWRIIRPFRVHVVYYVVDSEVRVIAYAHEARKPGYWRHRITQ